MTGARDARSQVQRPLILLVFGILIVGVLTLGCRARQERTIADLTSSFATARKQPSSAVFELTPPAAENPAVRCIRAQGPTRLTYHVTVPPDGVFVVRATVPEDRASGGVAYAVGVSDGHTYRAMVTGLVEGGDKNRGRDVRLQLEEYSGMTVDLVLNTRPANTRDPAGAIVLWCSPRIVS